MSVASSTTDETDKLCSTPSHSTMSEKEPERKGQKMIGRVFKIIDQRSKEVIALKNGRLGVYPETKEYQNGSHWICSEDFGWLCFRNTVSGTYIGYFDYKTQLESSRHEPEEVILSATSFLPLQSDRFVTRAQDAEDGSHILMALVKFRSGHRLCPVINRGYTDGTLVINLKMDEGTRWEFVPV